MTTFEEKLLGDKRENYCSSSEDDDEDEEYNDANETLEENTNANLQQTESLHPEIDKWSGNATNTGPKGVIRDWQRFKQLENEKCAEKEKERQLLMKKLGSTNNTNNENEKQKKNEELDADLDKEFEELMNDEILLEYQRKRMNEMIQMCTKQKQFGKVWSLTNGNEFLEAIDNENKLVTIIIHIYEDNLPVCNAMNNCLDTLAQEYINIKFCKIIASIAGLSNKFKTSGMPALLVYKEGILIGNFIRVTRELGDDFFPSDVESFLIEHAILPDKSHIPSIIIRDGDNNANGDDDDDDD